MLTRKYDYNPEVGSSFHDPWFIHGENRIASRKAGA